MQQIRKKKKKQQQQTWRWERRHVLVRWPTKNPWVAPHDKTHYLRSGHCSTRAKKKKNAPFGVDITAIEASSWKSNLLVVKDYHARFFYATSGNHCFSHCTNGPLYGVNRPLFLASMNVRYQTISKDEQLVQHLVRLRFVSLNLLLTLVQLITTLSIETRSLLNVLVHSSWGFPSLKKRFSSRGRLTPRIPCCEWGTAEDTSSGG